MIVLRGMFGWEKVSTAEGHAENNLEIRGDCEDRGL